VNRRNPSASSAKMTAWRRWPQSGQVVIVADAAAPKRSRQLGQDRRVIEDPFVCAPGHSVYAADLSGRPA
jgi:hypothetical protein